MLKLVVFVSFMGLALGLPAAVPETEADFSVIRGAYNYHEEIGIPEYERITKEEEAINFDGSRIVGGSAASVGQYPHFGGLIISLTNGGTSVCGSSLISNNRAVTAAHCWWDGSSQARQFEVALGTNVLNSGGTRIRTSQVVVHPNWTPQNLRNDVAVMILSWVNYSNNIRNIGLASGSNLYVGQNAWAVGFGAQRDGAGVALSQRLHHVSLSVISNADCQRWYGSTIAASNLCVSGANGRSTCGGDSGGPLQITGPTLIGITSFGYRWGCQVGWPAAFARVSSFEAWIRSRL